MAGLWLARADQYGKIPNSSSVGKYERDILVLLQLLFACWKDGGDLPALHCAEDGKSLFRRERGGARLLCVRQLLCSGRSVP